MSQTVAQILLPSHHAAFFFYKCFLLAFAVPCTAPINETIPPYSILTLGPLPVNTLICLRYVITGSSPFSVYAVDKTNLDKFMKLDPFSYYDYFSRENTKQAVFPQECLYMPASLYLAIIAVDYSQAIVVWGDVSI